MGRWVNVWNFREKSFFQNFNTFFCFENDLRATVCKNEPKFLHFDTDVMFSDFANFL